MKITKSDFGTTNTGENINIYHLENEAGAYVEILNFGCRLVKIVVPDRNGNPTDVCLGKKPGTGDAGITAQSGK